MGVKIPVQSTKYTRLWSMPSDSWSDWASEFAAVKHAEDYKILS